MRRFVAQSFASYRYIRAGGPIKTEDDPLDPDPAAERAADLGGDDPSRSGGHRLRRDRFALRRLLRRRRRRLGELVRKRWFPIVGDGGGILSWIHLEDAAAATVLALDHDGPASTTSSTTSPAPVREWLPVLAESVGAEPPRRLPPGSRASCW